MVLFRVMNRFDFVNLVECTLWIILNGIIENMLTTRL